MNSSLLLLTISAVYLLALFGVAHATERGWLPRHWARHPFVYILSLGVYAGAWAVFGAVAMADQFGYGYLAYYLGLCGAFLLAPVLLHPVLKLCPGLSAQPLADLFTFRYRSPVGGNPGNPVLRARHSLAAQPPDAGHLGRGLGAHRRRAKLAQRYRLLTAGGDFHDAVRSPAQSGRRA